MFLNIQADMVCKVEEKQTVIWYFAVEQQKFIVIGLQSLTMNELIWLRKQSLRFVDYFGEVWDLKYDMRNSATCSNLVTYLLIIQMSGNTLELEDQSNIWIILI